MGKELYRLSGDANAYLKAYARVKRIPVGGLYDPVDFMNWIDQKHGQYREQNGIHEDIGLNRVETTDFVRFLNESWVDLEILVQDSEALMFFGTTSAYYENYFIMPEGSTDIAGALEDTLHRILDNGGTDADLRRIMGVENWADVGEDDRCELEQYGEYTDIDLGYFIRGLITGYQEKWPVSPQQKVRSQKRHRLRIPVDQNGIRIYTPVMQRCNQCGCIFPVTYHGDGSITYPKPELVCECESDFSPVGDAASISEWIDSLKDEQQRFQLLFDDFSIRCTPEELEDLD